MGYALPSVLELLVGTKGLGTVTKGGKTTLDIPDNPDDFIDILKSNTDNDLPDAPTIVDDLADTGTGGTTPTIVDGVGDGIGGNGIPYSGGLTKVNVSDPHADALANRLGGQSSVKFKNDPNGKEFDVVSDKYIGEAKPGTITYGSSFRNQAKQAFEAAKNTGREVYYHFDSPPSQSIVNKLNEYSQRYNVPVKIDTTPL